MKYDILKTGSDGNCVIVNDRIAIDLGVPFRTIAPHIKALKIVLLTHIHGDHFQPRTAYRLHKERPTLRFAGCEWMIQPLVDAGIDRRVIDVIYPDQWYSYHKLGNFQAFRTDHNAPNCGWKIIDDDAKRLLYATDLGEIPEGLQAKGYDFYLLEANHREAEIETRAEEKLEAGVFSYETAAAVNHLSFEQAAEWLRQNMGPGSIWIPMHQHQETEQESYGEQDNKRDYPDFKDG